MHETSRVSITAGHANAFIKTAARRCPVCHFGFPKYPGRYPGKCPRCHEGTPTAEGLEEALAVAIHVLTEDGVPADRVEAVALEVIESVCGDREDFSILAESDLYENGVLRKIGRGIKRAAGAAWKVLVGKPGQKKPKPKPTPKPTPPAQQKTGPAAPPAPEPAAKPKPKPAPVPPRRKKGPPRPPGRKESIEEVARRQDVSQKEMVRIFDTLKKGQPIFVAMTSVMGMSKYTDGTYREWLVGQRGFSKKHNVTTITLMPPDRSWKPNKYNRFFLRKRVRDGESYIVAGQGDMALMLHGIKRPERGLGEPLRSFDLGYVESVVVCTSEVVRIQEVIDSGRESTSPYLKDAACSRLRTVPYEAIEEKVGMQRLRSFLEGPVESGEYFRLRGPNDPVLIFEFDDSRKRLRLFATNNPAKFIGCDPRDEFVVEDHEETFEAPFRLTEALPKGKLIQVAGPGATYKPKEPEIIQVSGPGTPKRKKKPGIVQVSGPKSEALDTTVEVQHDGDTYRAAAFALTQDTVAAVVFKNMAKAGIVVWDDRLGGFWDPKGEGDIPEAVLSSVSERLRGKVGTLREEMTPAPANVSMLEIGTLGLDYADPLTEDEVAQLQVFADKHDAEMAAESLANLRSSPRFAPTGKVYVLVTNNNPSRALAEGELDRILLLTEVYGMGAYGPRYDFAVAGDRASRLRTRTVDKLHQRVSGQFATEDRRSDVRRPRKPGEGATQVRGGFRLHVGHNRDRKPIKDVQQALQNRMNARQPGALRRRVKQSKEWHRSREGQEFHGALGRYNRDMNRRGESMEELRAKIADVRERIRARSGLHEDYAGVMGLSGVSQTTSYSPAYPESLSQEDEFDTMLRKLIAVEAMDVLMDVEFEDQTGAIYLFFDPITTADEMDEIMRAMQQAQSSVQLIASPDKSLPDESVESDWWVAFLPGEEGAQPDPQVYGADPSQHATKVQMVKMAEPTSVEQIALGVDVAKLVKAPQQGA